MAHVVSLFLFLPIFHLFSFFYYISLVSDISPCLINHILTRPNKIQKMMYVNLLICLWIDKGIQCKYDLILTLYLGMYVQIKCQRKSTISYFSKKYRKFFSTMKNCISYYILMPFIKSQRYVIFNGKKSLKTIQWTMRK